MFFFYNIGKSIGPEYTSTGSAGSASQEQYANTAVSFIGQTVYFTLQPYQSRTASGTSQFGSRVQAQAYQPSSWMVTTLPPGTRSSIVRGAFYSTSVLSTQSTSLYGSSNLQGQATFTRSFVSGMLNIIFYMLLQINYVSGF